MILAALPGSYMDGKMNRREYILVLASVIVGFIGVTFARNFQMKKRIEKLTAMGITIDWRPSWYHVEEPEAKIEYIFLGDEEFDMQGKQIDTSALNSALQQAGIHRCEMVGKAARVFSPQKPSYMGRYMLSPF